MQNTFSRNKRTVAPVQYAQIASNNGASSALLPLGAMLLAGSMSAMAQQARTGSAPAGPDKTLAPVTVREKAEAPEGKDSVRATTTTIGKGNQELRNIPQSTTVVTAAAHNRPLPRRLPRQLRLSSRRRPRRLRQQR